MYYECRHIMPNGAKCHSPALGDKNFCYYHTRLHMHGKPSPSTRATKKAKSLALAPVSLLPPDSEPLRIPVLEDRAAIQVALARILDAVASSGVDRHNAGLLIYGLQVASQNVERKQDILPFKGVQSVSHSSEGDELAPRMRVCEPGDSCMDCDQSEGCEDFHPDEDSDEDWRAAS